MRRALSILILALAVLVAPAGAGLAAESFPDRIALPDGFAPEGITSGPGTTFYVGSLVDGAIYSGDLRTGRGAVLVEGVQGTVAVGTEYDPATDRLWVAGGVGEVRVYDASSGELLATYSLEGTGFLNDVTVTRDAVYVTDSNVAHLVVIPTPGRDLAAPDAALTLPLTGDLVYVDGFNANGIVDARGGRTLLVVQSNTGLLFSVDPVTGASTTVDLGGDTLLNADGLLLRGRTLYAVRNADNLVAQVRLAGDLASGDVVRELTSDAFDVPTTVTFAAGRLYVVNARFGTDITPTTSYDVVRVPRR